MSATDLSVDRRAIWLTMLGIGVALGTLALGCVTLFEGRNDAWNQARQSANNLLLALDRDIGRNLTVLDLSLRGLTEALAEPGINGVSPEIRQHALFDRSASAEDLGSILVLDADGQVTADSTSMVPHPFNFADRDDFVVHRDKPGNDLYISRVFESRLVPGDLRFAISRRLTTADGGFGGVVSASLRLNYFLRLFERLDIGAQGGITLLRTDGRVLFRYPFRIQDVDADTSKRPNFPRISETKSGQYVAVSMLDDVERLYTYRRVGDLPLILMVNVATDEIFAPWRRKAAVVGLAMMLLCACAVASALLFRREMVRRAKSERALAAAAEQLTVLAATDSLTGLMNRRAFDIAFDQAFRTATRDGKTLSLLMIDADFFKRYNDTFGHVAGDDVLQVIAACVQGEMKRPTDRAARFGGEEFIAVLPDTDERAAVLLAERIRAGVKARHIDHDASPIGLVSISIGVATTTPLLGDRADHLLAIADQSLYCAKAAGRDCTRSAVWSHEHGRDFATVVRAAASAERAGSNA